MKKVVIYKVKNKENWLSWCNELMMNLRKEALSTLDEEKVVHEMAFLITIGKEDYVLGYMEGEMMPANMSHDINKKHKEMKEKCLEKVQGVAASVLYSFCTGLEK